MKNTKIFLIGFLTLVALAFSFFNYYYLQTIEGRLKNVEKNISEKFKAAEVSPIVQQPVVKNKNLTFTGTLKKEQIPEELELGDYWYWLYFDEPYTLEENASGLPMPVVKIQVSAPEQDITKLEPFDNKHVSIKGYITSGYAESSVIQIEEIVLE